MSTLWSGRFDQAPDAAAFEWGSSFSFDRRLFEDDVTGSIAWARALEGAGVLTADESTSIQRVLAAILEKGRANPAFVDGADEDVHSFVERLLVAELGDTGKRLHTGRSRNEQVSLDLRLYLRRRIPALQQAVAEIIAALTRQARSAGDALMPSYTHFRPAQPVLVAHFLMAHAAPLRRDFVRLEQARQEAGALTLGSGAIAGTSYGVDVSAIARELGFDRVVANSIDASSDRDFAATFLYAVSLTMVHLSRLSEDLIILCGDEHRFFEFSDALSTGSSMMPQKKNPDPLELVRGKTGRAIGDLMAMLTTMKGIPSGYNKDLQEDKHVVFDSEDTLAGCTAVVKSVIDGLSLNRARAAAAASGLLLATDVADYLVGKGVPFRTSHEIVGALVRKLIVEQREFGSLSLDEWRVASDRFEADVVERVTPAASVAAKRTPQSTAPAAVQQAIAESEAWYASVSGGVGH
ncbi:MAG: argininosuccinate lyase [Vicinamibacterales bacterium]